MVSRQGRIRRGRGRGERRAADPAGDQRPQAPRVPGLHQLHVSPDPQVSLPEEEVEELVAGFLDVESKETGFNYSAVLSINHLHHDVDYLYPYHTY